MRNCSTSVTAGHSWSTIFSSRTLPWVRHKGLQGPPKYEQNVYIFHILGLNLTISYQIASLFDMYIDMGERIAGKEDRPSLIIEDPPQGPPNSPKYFFFYILSHIWKN